MLVGLSRAKKDISPLNFGRQPPRAASYCLLLIAKQKNSRSMPHGAGMGKAFPRTVIKTKHTDPFNPNSFSALSQPSYRWPKIIENEEGLLLISNSPPSLSSLNPSSSSYHQLTNPSITNRLSLALLLGGQEINQHRSASSIAFSNRRAESVSAKHRHYFHRQKIRGSTQASNNRSPSKWHFATLPARDSWRLE